MPIGNFRSSATEDDCIRLAGEKYSRVGVISRWDECVSMDASNLEEELLGIYLWIMLLRKLLAIYLNGGLDLW